MDPLSLTAGVLALLGACRSASKTFAKLRRLKSAPFLIQALNNEVADLHLIMLDASEYLEVLGQRADNMAQINQATFELCTSSLTKAQSATMVVREALENVLGKMESQSKLKKRWRFLTKHTKLLQLQSELRDVRLQLTSLFSEIGLRKTSRVEALVDSLHSDGLPFLAEGQFRIEQKLNRILDPLTYQRHDNFRPSSRSNDLDRSTFIVPLSRTPSRRMSLNYNNIQSPYENALNTLFGKLFLGYVARPTVDSYRNRYSSEATSGITIFFMFPLWLLRYAILFQVVFGGSDIITCSLNMMQILAVDHPVQELLTRGDTEGISNLLDTRRISIKAQDAMHGGNLLSIALYRGNIDSVELLIRAGVDRCVVDGQGLSPTMLAWQCILGKYRDLSWQNRLASLFPNPDLDELFGFTTLHQAVLGLVDVSIETVLQNKQTNIDKPDYIGRTSLSWASASGNCRATQLLVANGADPYLRDNHGFNPLIYASRVCVHCCNLLVSVKTDTPRAEIEGSRGLIIDLLTLRLILGSDDAASSQGLEIMKTFVQAGFNFTDPDTRSYRAIHYAAHLDYFKVVEYLRDQGAEADVYSNSGHNPLTVAVVRNHHTTIETLLDKDLDHSTRLDGYGTLMHLAAKCADSTTLSLLSSAGLSRRDTSVKNSEGLSPLQLAMQRTDTDVEWQAAFWEFLKSIDVNQPD